MSIVLNDKFQTSKIEKKPLLNILNGCQKNNDGASKPDDNDNEPQSPSLLIHPSYRPILGQFSRFFGLLIFAICWVSFLIKGSEELFGSQQTIHELAVGSGAFVDFGFGGDYLGWGEVNTVSESGLPEFEFGEIADLIHDLVHMWHWTVTSWNETFHSFDLHNHIFKGTHSEIQPSISQSGHGFDPELFLHLKKWLATDSGPTMNPELLRNLSKAAENAAILLAEKAKKAASSDSTSQPDQPDQDDNSNPYFQSTRNMLNRRYQQNRQKANARSEARKIARENSGWKQWNQKQNFEQNSKHSVSSDSSDESRTNQDALKMCRRWGRPWTWLRDPKKCTLNQHYHSSNSENKNQNKEEEGKATEDKEEESFDQQNPSSSTCSDNNNHSHHIISNHEKEQLEKLRIEMLNMNPRYEEDALKGGMMVNDVGLMRYLDVAYGELEFKGKRVAQMVLDTLSWRVANNITQMNKEKLLEAAKGKQVHVDGFDKDGHAVVIFTPTVDDNTSTELAIYYLVFNLELAIALGEAGASVTGQKVSQYTFIVDLANIGTMPPLRTVKASFEVMARHYPMRPNKILLVHGRHMVQWIWRILEPLIDKRTREKVTLVPEANEHAIFSEIFEPSQLQKRFKSGESDYVFEPEQYIHDALSKVSVRIQS